MGFHILDGWQARKSLWVAVLDQTLPLAPVFWELVDVGAKLMARYAPLRTQRASG